MNYSVALLMGSFHKARVEKMQAKAKALAKELGLKVVKEVWVQGALEKPLALKRLLALPEIAGAAVLGVIEKGGTKHGLVMAQAVMPAFINLQLEFLKPVGIGIVGPEVADNQIDTRLEPYAAEAIKALYEQLNLKM